MLIGCRKKGKESSDKYEIHLFFCLRMQCASVHHGYRYVNKKKEVQFQTISVVCSPISNAAESKSLCQVLLGPSVTVYS